MFGRSLGGAVAFNLAAANPCAINSLIVENTFWSIEAVTGKVNIAVVSFHGSELLSFFMFNMLGMSLLSLGEVCHESRLSNSCLTCLGKFSFRIRSLL